MKKMKLLIGLTCMTMLFACQSKQKGAESQQEEEAVVVDYAAIVKEELPSMEEFLSIVDGFQRGTEKMLPTGEVWDNSEKEINKVLGAKDFAVKRNEEMGFFISATKNCEFNIKEENYIYSFSMTPNNTDSLSAAYYFLPMGDMYVKGEILLADTCIYNALVDQIKAAGYKPVDGHTDEWGNPTTEVKYAKENPQKVLDCYYYRCSAEENRITLELDFMSSQEISMR